MTKMLYRQELLIIHGANLARTSITHPLQIAAISAGPTFGRVGVTFCPGKQDLHSMTGPWERDLSLDLDTIRGWGAAAVVTLVKQHELRLLKVESLGEGVRNRGMLWFHLPILDVSIPDEAFERQWETDGATILKLLRDGQDVVVHCRGGIGRAGTIAGRLLVELGMDATSAIKQVRAVRAGAIETRAQELYVHSIGLSKQRSGVVTPD